MVGTSKKKAVTKKKTTKKKAASRTKKVAYLRQVELKYSKKRVSGDSPAGKKIAGSKQVAKLFSDLENETKEKLITISLDTKMKIISFEVVAIGGVNSISIRPFEAIRSAVALNAYGIIVVHNHPSGDPTPSKADKLFTKNLQDITNKGGMHFLDHIIIGDGDYISFADEGLL